MAAVAITGVTTAIAGVVKASVESYAEYEQLTGGVEKLFGNSSDTILKYANEAYKNAGINANDYMSQITSFSASLISSLGGDTAAAAEIGNMAINDMADNANTFGTNIQDIQNAYQGFAKQNYTMLDNLKLGYGGTKEEMQRLIDDANKLEKAMGKSGDLTVDSYADVVEAIHIVQNEMGITGTTAKEAQGTISGSIDMTKASWDNLIRGLSDSNANIPQLVGDVVSSASKVVQNVIPVVKEVLNNLPDIISEISPEAGAAFQVIVDTITGVLPALKDALSTTFDVVTNTITFVSEHTALLGTIAGIIGTITVAIGLYNAVAAIKAAMAAAEVTSVWGLVAAYTAQAAAMIVAIAPYLLIVAAIAAVIAIIVLCIKHWDEIKEAVSEAMKKIKETVEKGVNAVKGFFEKIINFVKENWQGLLLLIVNPFAGAFKLAYDNCEGFRNKVDGFIEKVKSIIQSGFNIIKEKIINPIKEAFNSVKDIFNNIVSTISDKMNSARDKVKTAIDKIKGFFNFSWSLPKIKTPKLAITWSQSPAWMAEAAKIVGLRGIPKFSVSWNALGGVFDKPTLFGYGNSLQGIGEDGAEAVVPLENNLGWLNKLADMLSSRMQIDSPIVMKVGEKTFGEVAVSSINALTKQTGNLPLVLG